MLLYYYTLYLSMFATTLSKHNVFREAICLTRGITKNQGSLKVPKMEFFIKLIFEV